MQNVKVTNDERGQEPVAEVHTVVMIKIIPDVFRGEFAIIIVSVMTLGDFLI